MRGDQTWIAERNRIYQQRRDLVLQAAQRMGLEARVPQAAIYVWAKSLPDGPISILLLRFWSSVSQPDPGQNFRRSGRTGSPDRADNAYPAFAGCNAAFAGLAGLITFPA
jgi:DNA-binding transcriptional MocR family regulator